MLRIGRLHACALIAIAWSGCGKSDHTAQPNGGTPNAAPAKGATEFVSADNQSPNGAAHGGATLGAANSGAPQAATAPGVGAIGSSTTKDASGAPAADPNRDVERGDVYRVLDDHRIVNLNRYRGVQIIDVSDLSHPRLEGQLEVSGDPVELYVVGEHAIVLLNNWQGYYGNRNDVKVESVSGGLVMNVDLSDRAHPALLDQTTVPGNISTSRLTLGDSLAALYVAANEYDDPTNGPHTVVKSFDVTGDMLVPKSELDLGGSVQDIQATASDVLLVASNQYEPNQGRSYSVVSVVDISAPDGTMVQGDTVIAAGMVQNKFNMDAYNGVLRVVSGANFNGATENHVQTFDMHDLSHLVALEDCRFASGDQLYATLFLENRGFFVTYMRTDPFHAFSIDDKGHCQEHSEFVVTGWNDFLHQTLGDTRLIGIGHNDQSSTTQLSVSLYDAHDLTNPSPLLARADIDLAYGYSQASWDDRAFSVLENAVSAVAADGTPETGLVLLPFEGWDQTGQTYVADVQLFTYSDHTLTRRGTMNHGSPVDRSFLAQSDTAANLSDQQLSLFDTKNPDAPSELGRLDVAPNYSALFVFGDYVARVKDRSDYVTASGTGAVPNTVVEILPHSANLDADAPVASFEVPAGSELIQVGDSLVSVTTTAMQANGNGDPSYHSAIAVYDLSDASQPKPRGTLETDRIRPSYDGGIYAGGVGIATPGIAIDCVSKGPCGGFGGSYTISSDHYAVGNAIAFVRTSQQQKSLGMVHECDEYAPGIGCAIDSSGNSNCPTTQVSGEISCRTPAGGTQSCSGGFYSCDTAKGSCTPIDKPTGTMTNCYDYDNVRYWQGYGFDVLDLRNPDAPSLGPALDAPSDEEGSSVLADGARLYFNFAKPYAVSSDGRDQVKRYFRAIDFSDPQKPSLGAPTNVPGDVIASDGTTIYTRDLVWGDTDTRTLVARLSVDAGLAHLEASRVFDQLAVQAVKLDGHGHVLVSGDPASPYGYVASSDGSTPQHKLEILDAESLAVTGEADVDSWATFMDAKSGRALYSVSGGLLVFNVEDAAHPSAQAYFPTLGWPSELYFDGQEILFAAGPYGVYRFDANAYNLLAQK